VRRATEPFVQSQRLIKGLAAIFLAFLSAFGLGPLPLIAAAAADSTAVALDYGSTGWSYKQVPYDSEPGFQSPGFDDTSWAVGTAAFGSTNERCAWNIPDRVHTAWNLGTDVLLRHRFTVPAGASIVHINGTVDDNADVYVNGALLQHVENGFCAADGINVDVPSSILGTDNMIAIRGRDLGDADFIDVQITYVQSAVPLHAGTFIDVLGAPPYESVAPGAECTTGFSVKKGSIRYVLGAAHCLKGHGVVNIWRHRSRTTAYGTLISCGATGLLFDCLPAPSLSLDFFAWKPAAGYLPDGYVMTGKGLLPVLGEIVPEIGDQICHYGKGSDGEVCGKHKLVDRNGYFGTKAYSVPGDSGGPAYEYVKAGKKQIIGVKAVGVVVEGQYHKPNGSTKAGSTIIPIATIEAALGVELIT
jgi:hypothetical protein